MRESVAQQLLGARKPFDLRTTRRAQTTLTATLQRIERDFGIGPPPLLVLALNLSRAVISGSFPLLALHPDLFTPENLDFYALFGTHDELIDFVETCGYTESHSGASADVIFRSDAIHSVLKYENGTRFIRIIIAKPNQDTLTIITSFHSTITMNFIAHYGLVCLYPTLTLKCQGILCGTYSTAWYEKYARRGIVFLEPDAHQCGTDPNCLNTIRTLHEATLFIPLGDPFAKLSDVEEEYEWRIQEDLCV